MIGALRSRVRTNGAAPLLTYYDLASGERTEFSARSVANWVDKTTNLLDELDARDGIIASPLALSHPAHWVSLIWPLASWQAGAEYRVVGAADTAGADVAVIGPDEVAPTDAEVTIACSLHPLALGLRNLPAGVLDYSTEALSCSDLAHPAPLAPSQLAWTDAARQLTHADLVALQPQTGRVLVRAAGAFDTLRAAIISPLLGGGSAVLVVGDSDPERLARLRASERCVE
ncbi:MAG: TIGR03089 family protein [Micropruina sp.]|nr:TIGR03089 family protein [Micropruina sp.]